MKTNIENELGIKIKREEEMESIYDGIKLCLDLPSLSIIYSLSKEDELLESQVLKNDFDYPFIVANIGSGVSIIHFSKDKTFKRIGGTCLGGSTFIGLCNKILNINSFDELLE